MTRFYHKITKWAWTIIAFNLWQTVSFGCSTVVLVSNNSHFGLVHHIEALLFAEKEQPKLIHFATEAIQSPTFFDKYQDTCLIVTIGAQALVSVLNTNTSIPVFSVLIRKNIFHNLLSEHHRSLQDADHPINVFYLDQPLERQFNLLKCLISKKNREPVGVLLGSQSLAEQEQLHMLAQKEKIVLNTICINPSENPVAALDKFFGEAKVMLAIPDHRIYNSQTARGLLLTAFHKRLPMIGYSRTFVNNGALGAVYSTTKQLAQQSAQQILALVQQQKLPPAQYPQEFAVAVNYQVAQTLGINIEGEAALKYALDKMELINPPTLKGEQ